MIQGTARFKTEAGYRAFLTLLEVGTRRQQFRIDKTVTTDKDRNITCIQVWWEPIVEMDIPAHLFSGTRCSCALCTEFF